MQAEMNFQVIDIANGSGPTGHETFDEAVEAARQLGNISWFIEDTDGQPVWSNDNEFRN